MSSATNDYDQRANQRRIKPDTEPPHYGYQYYSHPSYGNDKFFMSSLLNLAQNEPRQNDGAAVTSGTQEIDEEDDSRPPKRSEFHNDYNPPPNEAFEGCFPL